MFKISMKIFKVNPKSKDTSNKSSKFSNFFRSIVNKKPKLSIEDLEPMRNEVVKESTSKCLPSITHSSNSSISNVVLKKMSIRTFIGFVEEIGKKIPISLGIFGGVFALHQVYLSIIEQYEENFEMIESLSIIY